MFKLIFHSKIPEEDGFYRTKMFGIKKEERNYNRRYPEEYGFGGSLFYLWFLYFVVFPVGYIFYKVNVVGRENIDSNKRYIFAGNHNSYIDPPMVSLAANRKVAYMAKEELFTHPNWLLRHLVIWLRGFAVNRSKPELATFKTLKDISEKTNWSIGIFPQGTTTMGNDLTRVQKGFIVVAKTEYISIISMFITSNINHLLSPLDTTNYIINLHIILFIL